MGEPTTVDEAGVREPAGYTLLVAVGNPEYVDQLMRTAHDLARYEDGSIHVVSVVAKDYDSPFGIFDDETIRESFAGDRRAVLDRALESGDRSDVSVSGAVVVDRSVSRGIVETADAVDADALLVGWTTRASRTDAVLGTNVDALLERAPLDVYVERIGATANGVDGVLVPVAGAPHATQAVRAGHAIATANDAELTVLSIASEDDDRATRDVERALAALDGADASVQRSIRSAPDVVDAIATAALDHDVVVMGATRGGPLRARLVGSIPRNVADRTDRTVLLARRWTGPSKLTRMLGRLRRW